MRDLAQDVKVNYIELVSAQNGWSWDLTKAEGALEGNIFLWFVFSGRLTAEFAAQKWELPANHLLEIRSFDEPVSLTTLTPTVEVALVSYQTGRAGTRQSNRFLTSTDATFTKLIIDRAYERWLKRQLLEANALLTVLLDELVQSGYALESQNDSKLAHQLTQNKLKNIDWSRTQRFIPSN